MQTFWAVIQDLWHFVLEELGFRTVAPVASTTNTSATQSTKAITPAPLLLPGTAIAVDSATAPTTQSTKATTPVQSDGTQLYTRFPNTPCYLRPGQALDTMIGTLSYATAVTVLSRRDGWLQIQSDMVEGWVEEMMVTNDSAVVFPTFTVGEQYDVDHPDTMKVRTYIDDEFGGGIARASLLSCEYVWYRLLRAGRDFSWPLSRPRTAGRWADILQGIPSVHVGSVPLTGGVMEYLDVQGDAQLFFVTAVRPDESVVVSGIIPTPAGQYSEQTIKQTDWYALGARFINKK